MNRVAIPGHTKALLLSTLALALASCAQSSATDSTSDDLARIVPYPHARVCAAAKPGQAACHARVRLDASTGRVHIFSTPSGFGPSDLRAAYKLPSTGGSGMTIAIVDAQDDPSAEADLAVYRSTYGLPPCTTANGCFKKVNQSGQQSSYPTADGGWSQEIALDLDMASAACPSCKILLVEASTSNISDLGAAVNTAVSLGASVVSNSYGGPEDGTEPSNDVYYNHPGVLITASAGDSGYGASYPATSPYVLAVGGTSLVTSTSNPRGWTEGAWSSGGSGCSSSEAKPSWQHDTGCAKRMEADVSAVGDPNTGVAVYETYSDANGGGGGWQVFGGTSVSSPLVAAIFALTGHASVTPQFPYSNTSNFYDVTTGSNGTCPTPYFCTAGVGYDGPTGWGTPNGTLLASGGGGGGGSNDFSLSVSNSSVTLSSGSSTSESINTAIAAGSAESIALSISGLPSGVTGSFSPATVNSGNGSTLTITAASSAAAGSYTLTVTGTATSGAHTASIALTVTSTTTSNDFSLSVASSSLSVTAGSAATDSISTAIASGKAESISLSVSGLPSGVSAAFAPATVSSGAGATLTVSAASSATAGSYSVTVTGTAASGSHSANIALTVASSGGGGGSNAIVNGDFEAGSLSGWTAAGAAETVVSAGCHGGTYCAQLGSTGPTNGDSSISQTFTAASSATLSLWYKETCPDTITYDWALVTLKDNTAGSTTTVVAKTCATNAWAQASASVAAGHSYTLTLTSHDDNYSGDPTYTLYDDVSLGGSAPPPPPPSGGITNGGFESGLSGWTTSGASATATSSGCHSGASCAQLGSNSPTNGDSGVAQTFTAPTGTKTLTFWYSVHCPDTVTYDWATATLKDNTAGTSKTVLAKTCNNSGTWTQASATVTAGHSYTLTLTSHDDNYAGDPTYTLYDDVSVN